jgi:hypothetical protein
VGVKVLVGGVVEALEEEGPLRAMAIEVCVVAVDGFSFGLVVVVLCVAPCFALFPVVLVVKSVGRQVKLA